MTRDEFIKEVRAEIKRIKKRATANEIDKLSFEDFSTNDVSACIYGQMTGRCDSDRARELMPKKYNDILKIVAYRRPINEKTYTAQSMSKGGNFTALEKYLYMAESDTHEHIFDYLKDGTNRLNIE